MIRSRTLVIIFAAVAVSALAFAACGGDDDNGGSTATAQASKTAAASGTAAATTSAGAATTAAATATEQSNGGGDASGVCDLLTKADAEAALGVAVDGPDETNAGTMPVSGDVTATVSNCSYDSSTTLGSLSLDYWVAPGHDSEVNQLTELVCSTKEKINGIGDVACWYSSDHNELQFGKGSAFLDLHGSGTGDSGDTLKSLARTIADRAP